MTEREVVQIVAADTSPITDFSDEHWEDVDPATLESCYNKGFLRWDGEKLKVTPLGRRSCGGNTRERYY